MPTWHVTVHFTAGTDPGDHGETLIDELGPTTVVAPADLDRLAVTWCLDARTLPDATAAALNAFGVAARGAGYAGVDVHVLQVWDEAGFAAELERPTMPPLIGYPRIAAEYGISRQRAQQLGSEGRFGPQMTKPRPKAGAGPVDPPVFVESSVRSFFAGRDAARRPAPEK